MRARGHGGFSLIELMVVMTIISVLVMIALPRYQGSVANAKVTALKSTLHVMRDTIDRFRDDKGRYPETLQELVDQHYLKEIPVDPVTDSRQTWVPAEETIDDKTGMVDIHSGARGEAQPGTAYSDL